MFTGIVQEVGVVAEVRRGAESGRIVVKTDRLGGEVALGDSVAVNGACLTVSAMNGAALSFDVVTETLRKSTLGDLESGSRVNLEGALRVGDRLSGHFVMGHVDGVGEVVVKRADPGQTTVRVRAPETVAGFLLEKGSIAVNGVSLTIWDVRDREFSVAIVPHTLGATTIPDLATGSRVNLEADILARWVAKLVPRPEERGVTWDALRKAGWDIDR